MLIPMASNYTKFNKKLQSTLIPAGARLQRIPTKLEDRL